MTDYDATKRLLNAAMGDGLCAARIESPKSHREMVQADERARILRMLESLEQALQPGRHPATAASLTRLQRAKLKGGPFLH